MSLSERLNALFSDDESTNKDLQGDDTAYRSNTSEIDSDDDIVPKSMSISAYLKEEDAAPSKKRKSQSNRPNSYIPELDFFETDSFDRNFGKQDPDSHYGLSESLGETLREISENRSMFRSETPLSEMAEEFDTLFDDDGFFFGSDEDSEMRNHLLSLGRKYNRDHATSKEASEISQTFADSERRLKALYDELDVDKKSIQKDIDRMRMPGRSGKTFSELINAKNSMLNTQRQIIQEINSLKKTVFDLRAKEAAKKDAENAGSSDITPETLQSILSNARGGIMSGAGGYSAISGSSSSSEAVVSDVYDDSDDDEMIHRKYFHDENNEPSVESDGDKFLKYESAGVEYVLELDSANNVLGVHAEDKDGNVIDDYPMPSDISSLSFDVDHLAKRATDSLHRSYKIQIISD